MLIKDLSSVGIPRFPTVGSVAFYHRMSTQNMWDKVRRALEQLAKDVYMKKRLIAQEKSRP